MMDDRREMLQAFESLIRLLDSMLPHLHDDEPVPRDILESLEDIVETGKRVAEKSRKNLE